MKSLKNWDSGYIKYKLIERFAEIGEEFVLNKKDIVLSSKVDRTFTIESGFPDLHKLTILKVVAES